jgi:competence protein ComEC
MRKVLWVMYLKKASVVLAILLVLFSLLTVPLVQGETVSQSGHVTVYFWDIGQGDAILITAGDKNVLIDGGSASAGNTLLAYLWSVNVSHLDFVVATHPHEDHIGGLPAVMTSNITVNTVLYNSQTYTSQIYQQFLTLAQQHNLTVACRNQFYPLTATVNFTILSPTQPFELPSTDVNTNSVVLKLQVINGSFLFTGDATAEAEQNMLDAGLNVQSDVLKVGHHGSRTSTSQAFLDAVNPRYAVISAGLDNSYGHPHDETIQKLEAKGVTYYVTFLSGTEIFLIDGTTWTIVPEAYSAITLTLIAVVLAVSLFAIKRQPKTSKLRGLLFGA